MAHLWIQDAGGWWAQRLETGFDLVPHAVRPTRDAVPEVPVEMSVRLIEADAGGNKIWTLVASANYDVSVNGRRVLAGIRVLSDRDQIRVCDEVRYFSTETLAAVEPLPALERPVFCGRCRQLIETASPAVRCPGCGIWYNQSEALPCWTYSDKCTFCGLPTSLEAGFTWTPEAD